MCVCIWYIYIHMHGGRIWWHIITSVLTVPLYKPYLVTKQLQNTFIYLTPTSSIHIQYVYLLLSCQFIKPWHRVVGCLSWQQIVKWFDFVQAEERLMAKAASYCGRIKNSCPFNTRQVRKRCFLIPIRKPCMVFWGWGKSLYCDGSAK